MYLWLGSGIEVVLVLSDYGVKHFVQRLVISLCHVEAGRLGGENSVECKGAERSAVAKHLAEQFDLVQNEGIVMLKRIEFRGRL
jgi:hypothetical protein